MENTILELPTRKQKILKDSYEKDAWQAFKVVCGVDEVGRGCLAGPLVAAAVILHPNKTSRLVKDSKLLTKPELLKAYKWIIKNSWYGYAVISHTLIDTHNIYQANLMVMKRAVLQTLSQCPMRPTTVLVDAMPLNLASTSHRDVSIRHYPKGESWSSSIAAASIIAKVKRDALIGKMDAFFPGYNLANHKGYSTKTHCQAVRSLGRSIIHRVSFLDKVMSYEEPDHGNQSSLC